jgi:hypothetical protein
VSIIGLSKAMEDSTVLKPVKPAAAANGAPANTAAAVQPIEEEDSAEEHAEEQQPTQKSESFANWRVFSLQSQVYRSQTLIYHRRSLTELDQHVASNAAVLSYAWQQLTAVSGAGVAATPAPCY